MECGHKILLKSGLIVPCGKCPSCLANQRQEWIFRLHQEYLSSVFAVFVTLTYDDDHIPDDFSVNKKDVQLFHKRLRKHFPSGDMRFYLVSEYGDHTFRPHYHGLYFFRSKYDDRFIYDTFEESWNKGFIKFGRVEEGSIVYCTKYCLKHSATPEGRAPTFRLMSKMNGGLGYEYLAKMSDWHLDTENFAYVSSFGRTSRMPKYYKDVLHSSMYGDAQQKFDDNYDRQTEKFGDRFREFLKDKHFATFEEAKTAFNEQLKYQIATQDELIIKHCKKQAF